MEQNRIGRNWQLQLQKCVFCFLQIVGGDWDTPVIEQTYDNDYQNIER